MPGLRGVGVALSVATYPGWRQSGKVDLPESHKQKGKCRDWSRDTPSRLLTQFASRVERSILRRWIFPSVICELAVC